MFVPYGAMVRAELWRLLGWGLWLMVLSGLANAIPGNRIRTGVVAHLSYHTGRRVTTGALAVSKLKYCSRCVVRASIWRSLMHWIYALLATVLHYCLGHSGA